MVIVPTGSFLMGDGADADRTFFTWTLAKRIVRVRIEKAFAMGRYPITFDEYDRFASATSRPLPVDGRENPVAILQEMGRWGRGRRPVINVAWEDAVLYAKWLSRQTGERYRLPTEAEWEYAARAGTTTAYWWGEEIKVDIANFSGPAGDEWPRNQWAGKQTSPVGSFPPNPFGLYDTAGNVWEWVEDCWHDNYNGAPTDGSAWLTAGGGDCGQRVVRGGSWTTIAHTLRSSSRHRLNVDYRSDMVGFRVARDIE
jgi:formylglycine-generating enzyme required for sulfatase activity